MAVCVCSDVLVEVCSVDPLAVPLELDIELAVSVFVAVTVDSEEGTADPDVVAEVVAVAVWVSNAVIDGVANDEAVVLTEADPVAVCVNNEVLVIDEIAEPVGSVVTVFVAVTDDSEEGIADADVVELTVYVCTELLVALFTPDKVAKDVVVGVDSDEDVADDDEDIVLLDDDVDDVSAEFVAVLEADRVLVSEGVVVGEDCGDNEFNGDGLRDNSVVLVSKDDFEGLDTIVTDDDTLGEAVLLSVDVTEALTNGVVDIVCKSD